MSALVHGTAVAINGSAVLLTGKSGSGKSDLALRLVDRGAALIGDDYVEVGGDDPIVAAKTAIAGKIEIRGVGIIGMPYAASAPLRLVVELGEDGERLPASWPLAEVGGWSVPKLKLNAFAASAPLKVEHAVKSLIDGGIFPVRLRFETL
jgi:HPr kinase/phosphorylase